MIRKLFLMLFGYIVIGLIISLNQSCNWKYDSYICDINFTGINKSYTEQPDDLTNEIGFQITSDNYCKSAFNRFNLDLFSTSYAMTKCAEWQNSLDILSYTMTFDRKIIYHSAIIQPNTDILKNDEIRNSLTIDKEEECKSIYSTIKFSSKLKADLTFESGIYNVTFHCRTTDGKEFVKQRKVIFKNN